MVKSAAIAFLLLLGTGFLAAPGRAAEGDVAREIGGGEGAEVQATIQEESTARPPARKLVGTPWKQLPSANPRTKIQDVHYLMFKDRGELMAVGECAHFWGRYRIDGDGALVITDFRAKRQDCGNAAGGDKGFVTNLIMANTYRIEGTELALYQGSQRLIAFGATAEMPAVEKPERHRAARSKNHASVKAPKSKGKESKKKSRR